MCIYNEFHQLYSKIEHLNFTQIFFKLEGILNSLWWYCYNSFISIQICELKFLYKWQPSKNMIYYRSCTSKTLKDLNTLRLQ